MALIVLDGELPRAPRRVVHVLHERHTPGLQRVRRRRGIVGFQVEVEVLAPLRPTFVV
jgi:hypothetical protein